MTRSASRHIAGVEPARQHERHGQRRGRAAAASRTPGRGRRAGVASRGARASNSMWSAMPGVVGDAAEVGGGLDRRPPSSPAVRTALACRDPRRGFRGRGAAASAGASAVDDPGSSAASSASTVSATLRRAAAARAGRAPRPAPSSRWRGEGSKNTKPTMSAPAVECRVERLAAWTGRKS